MEFDRYSRQGNGRQPGRRNWVEESLVGLSFPVVGLATGSRPNGSAAVLAGVERTNDVLTVVRVRYAGADAADPWAMVQTARWTGTVGFGVPVSDLLRHDMRLAGDRFSAVEWTETAATVSVDGEAVEGRILQAGRRWWAAHCRWTDLEISIVARDWPPGPVALVTVADPVGELDLDVPRPPATIPPALPVPEEFRADPLRALVKAAILQSDQTAAWVADGGPEPLLPPYWTALWRAAVAAQLELTGQTEEAVNVVVRDVLDQLTALQRGMAWFREDQRLRGLAITETLLYGTGRGGDVGSRPAQEAWQHMRRNERGEPWAIVAAQRRWADAWAAWVTGMTQG